MNEELQQSKYWHRFWTVPNAFTLLRIASSVGLVTYLAMYGAVLAPNILLPTWAVLTAATDFVDGALARTFHQQSKWGQALDPIADKVLNWGVALVLMTSGIMPLWVLAIGARDVAVGLFTAKRKYQDGIKQEKEKKETKNIELEATSSQKKSKLAKLKKQLTIFAKGESPSPTYPAKMKMTLQSVGVIATLAFGFGSASVLSLLLVGLASIGAMTLPDFLPTTERTKNIYKLLSTALVTIAGSLLLGPAMIAPIMMSAAISMVIPEIKAIKKTYIDPVSSTVSKKPLPPRDSVANQRDQKDNTLSKVHTKKPERSSVDYTVIDKYIEEHMTTEESGTIAPQETGFQYKR